jgi:hypothetical protein
VLSVAQDNGAIFSAVGKAMNKHANKNIKTCVVGNPANTNCLIAAANAPDINPANFTAMTRLDHNRLTPPLLIYKLISPFDFRRLLILRSQRPRSARNQGRPPPSHLHPTSLLLRTYLSCMPIPPPQANCSVNDIQKFAIWGNHSPTM